MEYYLVRKKDEILPVATTWVDLRVLRENKSSRVK